MLSLKRRQGASFEKQARLFLEAQGLRFVAANCSFKCGEIDLIMYDRNTIVFIEVRQRSHDGFGSAAESVDRRKQQKWVDAAALWLAERNSSLEDTDCRFDLITFGRSAAQIQWFKNFIE
ncbi:YraN family protein [Mesocricetibacter intestinalis]|uniref:YraN family protein n=1 Tax=Mesocricetibacter intestinalis TaxID=1521930 RepID=UPI00105B66E6|nr:YraN family protein [Mesocricetibacter intestinalis]